MKKSIKRIINKRLRKLVGHKVIRTGPTVSYDSSYTDEPLILKGFTKSGELIVSYPKENHDRETFGNTRRILPIEFTDGKWMLYSRVFKKGNSKLNKWCGKQIRRIKPVYLRVGYRIFDFMDEPVTLISASKSHLVIKVQYDFMSLPKIKVRSRKYADPRDWELAE